MATITLTIPDDKVQQILDGVCQFHGYNPSSGLTKAEFAKFMIIQILKNTVKDAELQTIRDQTEATLRAAVEAIDIT